MFNKMETSINSIYPQLNNKMNELYNELIIELK